MTSFDAIVVGSGSAGLFAALELQRDRHVLVVTKAALSDASTNWAQGGIAAAVGDLDTPERHFQDTVAAGAGLVDEEAASVLCREGPEAIAELVRRGVSFDLTTGGRVDLALEAAHSLPRVLHAGGDRTGEAIEAALAGASRSHAVDVRTGTFVTRLLVEGGRAVGVETACGDDVRQIEGRAVVVATGGAGQLFSFTTNPEVATGDGVALAFAAGAEVCDLEFFQFHPTALRLEGQRPFLISEAVRGAGANLRNLEGEPFMSRHHSQAELAPRDVVTRAIASEMQAAGSDHVLLDCTHLTNIDLAVRFPGIFAFCLEAGIDLRKEPIPVAPAAHYFMGGIRTDIWGRTTLPGLYACGEAASTGVHGANRLASNSLLETVVFARRAVKSIGRGDSEPAPASDNTIELALPQLDLSRPKLQALMWTRGGITRSGDTLRAGIVELEEGGTSDRRPSAPPPQGLEERNLALTGRLMLEAALRRTESRGAHYRLDFPERDDRHWRVRLSFRKAGGQ
ncbi:MAG: L-aspartate oxidase [Dehalococcoidia bacterium]